MDYGGLASCLSCCECSAPIAFNPLNLCEACIINRPMEIPISTENVIEHCFTCSRFLSPPSFWIPENNTQQLLHACVKLIKGLNKFKVKNAKFLWTEPHSKRLIVELVIEQDISTMTSAIEARSSGAVIERTLNITYVMRSHICGDCQREAAKDYWNASVQVRQRTSHKKTMYYMEQIILKSHAHKECLNIKKVAGGVDFFFSSKSHAANFVQFLQRRLPIRYTESKKLIGHDIGNSTYNYKYTWCVELPPVCKDDLVCLPKGFAQKLGNFSQLCIVSRITNQIHLIDPISAKTKHIDASLYYQNAFYPVASKRNLAPFYVVESEICGPSKPNPGDCAVSTKHSVADTYVLRENDMAVQIHTRTHLGNIINAGDVFLGIDMTSLNHNNDELDKIKSDNIPDVILIKKQYDRARRKRARQWKLKRLHVEDGSTNTEGDDRDEFYEDLEEDPELRANVNVYHNYNEGVANNDEFNDLPTIPIEEMLRNLDLYSHPVEDEHNQPQLEIDAEMMDM